MEKLIIRVKVCLWVLLCWGMMMCRDVQARPIIDSNCYNQILSYLYISRDDVTTYKKIFKALEKEDFRTVDNLIEDLDSDILMGHVLAEKYLSKTYKSKYVELQIWLEKYGDLPQADKIYRLASRKGREEGLSIPVTENRPRIFSPYSWFNNAYENLSPANRAFVRKKVTEFRKNINKGKTRAARAILEDKKFRMIIPNREYDAMSATLATVYFLDNEDALALKWVEKAARRSQDATAYWFGGLAAWRMKNYKLAADYFGKLGKLSDNDEWLVSAGAYWGYRAQLRRKNKTEAEKLLRQASKYKRTFYGILANYKLGNPMDYNWSGASYLNDFSNYEYINELVSSPAIRRAIILVHAKRKDLAEKELRADLKNMSDKQKEAAMYIADQYHMHALGILISNQLKKDDKAVFYDHLAYPAPNWKPKSGWKLDRALVLALVRQESGFMPNAGSGAGAKGLMQLMPNTAFHITKDRRLKKDHTPLLDVEYNLETGQKYVNYLLEKPFINGNLFFLTTAYNAGPGNLLKWQKKMKYGNDPLMFIETLPARETRIYIERVMANFWVYSAKFDKEHKSLEELAAGKWPTL